MSKYLEERLAACFWGTVLVLPVFAFLGKPEVSVRVLILAGLAAFLAWGHLGSRPGRAAMIALARWVSLFGSFGLLWRAASWKGKTPGLLMAVQVVAGLTGLGVTLLLLPLGQSFWLGWLNSRFPETAQWEGEKGGRLENCQPYS